MTINFNNLLNQNVNVHIQYIDVDKSTILHEKKYSGIVKNVDMTHGISIKQDSDEESMAMIPPAIEAWSYDENNVYQARWLVYRMQTEREDGQHEWWDWQPNLSIV